MLLRGRKKALPHALVNPCEITTVPSSAHSRIDHESSNTLLSIIRKHIKDDSDIEGGRMRGRTIHTHTRWRRHSLNIVSDIL